MPYLTISGADTLAGRIAFVNGDSHRARYVYVVGVFGDDVRAVDFTDAGEVQGYVTLPQSAFAGSWSYSLADFPSWVEPLERLFQQTMENSAESATEAPSAADVEDRIRQAVRERENALRAEFEQWKRNATEVAHDYADRNSLCSEFDRCMEEIGLEPREREWEVSFTISYSGSVTITATDGDSAADILSENWGEYIDSYDVKAYADFEVSDVESA